LLGYKGGVLRKTFYSSVAVAVALSACYPKQSANLLDQVYVRIKNESKNLFDSKFYINEFFKHKKKHFYFLETTPNQSTIERKIIENKDRILHTAKTGNEPILTVKGDYGQGTPADQHLYTTRGVDNPTSLNTEKKL